MKHRVVVTGMGVVAPNAVGIDNFLAAIQEGRSGITFHQKLQELKFSCCIGGIPLNIRSDEKQVSNTTYNCVDLIVLEFYMGVLQG